MICLVRPMEVTLLLIALITSKISQTLGIVLALAHVLSIPSLERKGFAARSVGTHDWHVLLVTRNSQRAVITRL